MAQDEFTGPQIYLATPSTIDLQTFPALLGRVLSEAPVACLRLSIVAEAREDIARAADACRDVAHRHDVAMVIDDHFRLVGPLGLDGVHLTDGARHVREARKLLGADGIVGAFCGASKHEGMTAAEIGTDYIAFGPLSDTARLGDGTLAPKELFAWWTEMIEVPIVAMGGLTVETLADIKDVVDFVSLGSEVWGSDDPVAAFKRFAAALA